MGRTGFGGIAAAAFCLGAGALQAQELAVGLGGTQYREAGSDGGILSLDYRHTPFLERRVLEASLAGSLAVSAHEDLFLGVGVINRWSWASGWFIDFASTPGIFKEGIAGNDLGSDFQIRSYLSLGYRFDNGTALSGAFSHISNADISAPNPGMNAFSVRYHIPF